MIPGIVAAQAGSGTPPTDYWNSADKSADISLLSANQLAVRESSNNSAWVSIRSVAQHNSGKWYAECSIDTDQNNAFIFGVAPSGMSLATYPGGTSTSFGIFANYVAGTVPYLFNNAGSSASSGLSLCTTGHSAQIAIDFDAGKLWLGCRGSWHNSGDPAAGTGETYTFTANSTLYLAAGMYSTVLRVLARFQSADFQHSAPSGFSAWE